MNKKEYIIKDNLRLFIAEISNKLGNFKGKARLFRLLDDWFRTDGTTIIKTIDSVKYELNTQDVIDFRLFYFSITEKGVLAYLSKQIGSRETELWDVGANVGSVCLPLLYKCPHLSVHAFEPSPSIFNRLKVNKTLNPSICSRISLENVALSNLSGMIDFFESAEPENSGIGSLGKMHNTIGKAVQVSCWKGDDLITIKSLPKPSILKIDVEGFEYEVIEGLKFFLESSNEIKIVFEHEPYRLKERGLERDVVIKLLQELGFRLYVIEEGDLTEFSETMLAEHHDFIACK